jgi:maleylpyruvate isomerase
MSESSPADIAGDPLAASALCRGAHGRLLATAARLTDAEVLGPSLLPDWTVGHVLTHLARNADGHVRRLEGALGGMDVPRYPGGAEQRDREIAEGSSRPASEIHADLVSSAARLEETWTRSVEAGWPHADLRGTDWLTSESPLRRLQEVEIHHADLGLDYSPTDWPPEYVRWELTSLLGRLPERLRGPDDARQIVAWLTGRRPTVPEVELEPW